MSDAPTRENEPPRRIPGLPGTQNPPQPGINPPSNPITDGPPMQYGSDRRNDTGGGGTGGGGGGGNDGGGGGGNPPPQYDMSIYAGLRAWLESMGLQGLFTVVDGQPSGWLWEEFKAGRIDSEAELALAVESTQVWQSRFRAIVEQRRRAAQGEPVQVMNERQVLDYEYSARQLMRMASLPDTFYNEPADFVDLLVNQVSLNELQGRVQEGIDLARNVAPEIRTAFESFYGAQGDANLVAFFLDPQRTMRDVAIAGRAAFTAGRAAQQGLQVDQMMAERVAGLDLSRQQIEQGVQQAGTLASLSEETFGESRDITDSTIVGATLGVDSQAQVDLQRRLLTRQATNRQATGGAIMSQEGVLGAG